MPEKQWVLTDVASGVWRENFVAGPNQLPDNDKPRDWFPTGVNWGIRRNVLRGGLSEGVEVVELNNGKLSVSVLPTRGMGLWKGTYNGLFLGWHSPVKAPVNPAFVNQVERGGLGWLSGFNEWMCRCGLDSNGAPGNDVILNNEGHPVSTSLTLHGKIANTPAHKVMAALSSNPKPKISVTGVMDESMLFGPALRLKSTVESELGSNSLVLIDEVTNMRGVPAELELLYHTNMGPPFLEKEAKVVAPVIEVAPRDARAVEGMAQYDVYSEPIAGYTEQCYWMNLLADKEQKTLVLLRNAHGDKGISLHFSKMELPCFTIWKNTQAEADGYVTGLEPATNYPNLKTFERKQGRVITLPPGGTYKATLEIQIHDDPHGVAAVEEKIQALQKTQKPVLHQTPQGKFSPVG
ncbi:MAG: aldose 1-epimerase family protein [Planctomycetales bacterium]